MHAARQLISIYCPQLCQSNWEIPVRMELPLVY